jgi:hypothetical protein
MRIQTGDRVRKVPRRGCAPGGPLGQVVTLVMLHGKEWARIASGKAQLTTSLWPTSQLEKVS